jgi:hypothetical protein
MTTVPRTGMVHTDPWFVHGDRRREHDAITPLGLPFRRFWTDSGKVNREGHCRMCLRPGHVRQLSRHHLIPQHWWRQRGELVMRLRNAGANIVPLCRQCHDEVETSIESRRMLRRVMTQEEVAFVIDVIGLRWLERRYPTT